jgi:peptide/nickel transport system permease protein
VNRHWLLRRSASSVLVLFVALVINFLIPRLMPGDPVQILAGGVNLTPEVRQALIERFGLNAPLWDQFWRYIINAFRGDFGLSFSYYPSTVTNLIAHALPWTLLVLVSSLILQVVIGYFLGVTSAWKVGTKTDSFLQTFSLAILAAPLFWVAMVLLFFFGFQLNWFPLAGTYTYGATYSNVFQQIADIMRHAALPIISYTIAQYATYQIILRNTMVGVLKEQYILTAEAKGLSENAVKFKHAARTALLPMITFAAFSFSITIGGSVYVETIFSYPGIGLLTYNAIIMRDYPVLQGCFFMFCLVVILMNFLVDILYMYLDPRIRY